MVIVAIGLSTCTPPPPERNILDYLIRADGLKSQALKLTLDTLLPTGYQAVDSKYLQLKSDYASAMGGVYDADKAIPFRERFNTSIGEWTGLIETLDITTEPGKNPVTQLEIGINKLKIEADNLRQKAIDLRLNTLLPEDYQAVDKTYMTLKSAYESAMVGKFNAEKAGPYKVKFETSRDDWKALIDHGNAFMAMADAQTRMTRADANKISVDYSTEYTAASTAMAESKTAYEGTDYVTAADKAKLVSSTLSDEFQTRVVSERKALADLAIADATDRMTWAADNKISEDYSTEFGIATTALAEAKATYELQTI